MTFDRRCEAEVNTRMMKAEQAEKRAQMLAAIEAELPRMLVIETFKPGFDN